MTVYEHTFPTALIVGVLAAALIAGALSMWVCLSGKRTLGLGLFAIFTAAMLGMAWCLLMG